MKIIEINIYCYNYYMAFGKHQSHFRLRNQSPFSVAKNARVSVGEASWDLGVHLVSPIDPSQEPSVTSPRMSHFNDDYTVLGQEEFRYSSCPSERFNSLSRAGSTACWRRSLQYTDRPVSYFAKLLRAADCMKDKDDWPTPGVKTPRM